MTAFDPDRWPDPHQMLATFFYRRLHLRSSQWAVAEDLAGKVVKAVLEAEARGQEIDERYINHTAVCEGRQYWQREYPKAERTVYLSAPVTTAADEERTVGDTLAAPRSAPHDVLADERPFEWSDRLEGVDLRPHERQTLTLLVMGYSGNEQDRMFGLAPDTSTRRLQRLRARLRRAA